MIVARLNPLPLSTSSHHVIEIVVTGVIPHVHTWTNILNPYQFYAAFFVLPVGCPRFPGVVGMSSTRGKVQKMESTAGHNEQFYSLRRKKKGYSVHVREGFFDGRCTFWIRISGLAKHPETAKRKNAIRKKY
jgi:hypothetical protein